MNHVKTCSRIGKWNIIALCCRKLDAGGKRLSHAVMENQGMVVQVAYVTYRSEDWFMG